MMNIGFEEIHGCELEHVALKTEFEQLIGQQERQHLGELGQEVFDTDETESGIYIH